MASNRKTYPALPWLAAVAAAVFAVGVVRFFAGSAKGDAMPLLVTLGIAGAVAFLSLAFPRRVPATPPPAEGPPVDLKAAPRADLKGALEALERQHEAGELSDARYEKAKAKVEAALRR